VLLEMLLSPLQAGGRGRLAGRAESP
jgi:hypothetical protein